MVLFCDRCSLGWNNCCAYRIVLEKAIADSTEHVCEELGFYKVPFSLQIKRINSSIKKVKKMDEFTS